MDEFAPEAVTLLLPHLDAIVADSVEPVDGTNASHPGQTFDFAVRRADGGSVAIAVVRAWDEVFPEAADGWDRLCGRVEAAVQRDHPELGGRYTVGFDTGITARMKDQKIDALVGAITTCHIRGVGSRVDLGGGVTVRHAEDGPVLTIQPYRVAPNWELGPASHSRFAKAIASRSDALARAEAAGYETHLAVIHWTLRSAAGWRQWLADNKAEGSNSQNIWAIDLNLPPESKGRTAVERIYP
jgi:hypothetical protein